MNYISSSVTTGAYSPEVSRYSASAGINDSGAADLKAALLQGVEIPENSAACSAFLNQATAHIDQLRYPIPFPQLKSPFSMAQAPPSPTAEAAEKQQLIRGLIARSPNSKELSPDQAAQLEKHLSILDSGVLRTIDAQGMKIAVARAGKPLSETGAITEID